MNKYIRKAINKIGVFFRNIFKVFYRVNINDIQPSSEPIDIIIPLIPKDLDIFPLCLEALRKNIVNNIENIYIVGPNQESIVRFCEKENLVFVDENLVLGFSVKDVNFVTSTGIDRSGWMFQQFLKLSGNIGTCNRFVTIDSDHILINKHIFLTKEDKFVFYRSSEFNICYYLFNYRLLRKRMPPALSFISHKMIFDKQELSRLRSYIEKTTNYKWCDGIMKIIDRNVASPFSEFELYATFLDKKRYISVEWNQKTLRKSELKSLGNLIRKYNKHLSITFPAYLNS